MESTSKLVARLVVGLTALVAVVVVLSNLPGCGPEKTLPEGDKVATTPRDGGSLPAVPAASEEKARQVVERAIKAMTDGHPERVEKTKVNKSTAKGHYYKPVASGQYQFVETRRVFQTAYPDKVRVEYDFLPESSQMTIGLRRPTGVWARVSNGQTPVFDPQQYAEIVSVDALGTYWLLTLTPLAEPKTVVYGLATTAAGGRPFDTVKAVVPGYPVEFKLWFGQSDGLLARIEYTHLEGGAPVSKLIAVAEPRAFAGLTLPTKIEYTRNAQRAEQWTVESWEFPDAIDDAVFTEPK
jgi:hypothetical protein